VSTSLSTEREINIGDGEQLIFAQLILSFLRSKGLIPREKDLRNHVKNLNGITIDNSFLLNR
jgi:hypothetical protein